MRMRGAPTTCQAPSRWRGGSARRTETQARRGGRLAGASNAGLSCLGIAGDLAQTIYAEKTGAEIVPLTGLSGSERALR